MLRHTSGFFQPSSSPSPRLPKSFADGPSNCQLATSGVFRWLVSRFRRIDLEAQGKSYVFTARQGLNLDITGKRFTTSPPDVATAPLRHPAASQLRHFATSPHNHRAAAKSAPRPVSRKKCLDRPGHHVAAAPNGIFRPPSEEETAYASTSASPTLVWAAYPRSQSVTGLSPKVGPFG